MQLFKGRYIAIICMCFMIAFSIPEYIKLPIIILCSLITVIILAVSRFFHKKAEIIAVLIMLCCIGCLCGLLRSYFAIDRRQDKAIEYAGNRNVEITVVSQEALEYDCSEYIINITQIGDESTDIRALAIIPFYAELHEGDIISAKSKLIPPNEKVWGISAYERCYDKEICLGAIIYDEVDITVNECGKSLTGLQLLFKNSGGEITVNKIRRSIGDVFDTSFGDDVSPLAKGFFMNYTSDISVDAIRDFRRCGASHLMAVSGMHITILLGAVDRLLTYLFVDKKIRIIIISVLSLGLMIITGFSASACRSVIMLLITYVHFFFADDGDGVTALFFAVALILLIDPYSCYDIGLWMSFLSTLGIITVYSYADERIPRPTKKKKWARALQITVRSVLTVVLMTLVANLFVLPFSWKIFGQISLVAVPANLMLSPIATLFLAEIPIVLIISKIPYVGDAGIFVMKQTEDLMLKLMRLFSKTDWAVQNLNYVFADIIVLLLIVSVAVMLVIKLKSKLFMIIPPAAAVIAFAVCIILTNYKQPAKAVFIADGDAQMIVVSNDGKTVLYDVANASSDMYYDGYDISCEYGGSKIDSIIYACFNELQPDILLRIGKSTIVDEIRLPQPKTDKDIAVAENLLSVAENIGASVLIYNDEEFFLSEKETSVYIDIENEGAAVVSIYSGETMINFFDPSVTDKDLSNIVNSGEIAILSSGFDKKLESKIVLSGEILEKFLFASEKAYNKNAIETNGIPIYVNKEKYKTWNVSFLLE